MSELIDEIPSVTRSSGAGTGHLVRPTMQRRPVSSVDADRCDPKERRFRREASRSSGPPTLAC